MGGGRCLPQHRPPPAHQLGCRVRPHSPCCWGGKSHQCSKLPGLSPMERKAPPPKLLYMTGGGHIRRHTTTLGGHGVWP